MNPSATELSTAATDAALGVLCLVLLVRLERLQTTAAWKKRFWAWVFGLMVLASALGAWAHGFDLSDSLRSILWQPLYLSLGLAVALFLVGAIAEWRGEAAARRLLPWAIAAGVGFWVLSQRLGGAFILFVAYESMTMVAALAIYAFLAATRRLDGAVRISTGIGLTLIAAAIQVSPLSLRAIVTFDHNGLFHIVQMIATITIAAGVRRTLEDTSSGTGR